MTMAQAAITLIIPQTLYELNCTMKGTPIKHALELTLNTPEIKLYRFSDLPCKRLAVRLSFRGSIMQMESLSVKALVSGILVDRRQETRKATLQMKY